MPVRQPRRKFEAKFKGVAVQPETQTLKANNTPRLGQGMTKGKPMVKHPMSAYHKLFAGQRKGYALEKPSYNVGRTRRCA